MIKQKLQDYSILLINKNLFIYHSLYSPHSTWNKGVLGQILGVMQKIYIQKMFMFMFFKEHIFNNFVQSNSWPSFAIGYHLDSLGSPANSNGKVGSLLTGL